nr:retrovirus-related Pol polyprotein from transposon TNT 1-94 [Tanacetum cinerariifolium]
MAEDGKLKIDSMMVMILVSRSVTGAEGTIDGRKQSINKSKSWKIRETGDKEVNMETRDSDDALVCCGSYYGFSCIVPCYILQSRAKKVQATLHWTLKDVMYIPGLKKRLISVGIGMNMLASKGNVPDVRKSNEHGASCRGSEDVMADSVSTAYLIYRIPYVLIGLRILEKEWQGEDTSLAHLKVFGCNSFVKEKDVYREAMKCIFIGSGSDEMRYNFQDMKSHQVYNQPSMTAENPAKNESIVAEHGLSSKITQILCGCSDTSEGSENSRSFKDSGRSYEEYYEDGASSKEGGSKTPHIYKEFDSSCEESKVLQLGKACLDNDKRGVLIFVEDSWNEEPCRDVHQVKENQEKDKIESKQDKNGKRGEAEKSLKQLQLKEEEKPKKTKKEWPKTHTRIKSYASLKKEEKKMAKSEIPPK